MACAASCTPVIQSDHGDRGQPGDRQVGGDRALAALLVAQSAGPEGAMRSDAVDELLRRLLG